VLVKSLGPARFAEQVEAEWALLRDTELRLQPEDVKNIRARFDQHPYLPAAQADDGSYAARLAADSRFAAWAKRNLRAHRQPGYAAVFVSLKASGIAPGDVTDSQFDAVAALAERHSFGEARATHDQNLVLAEVPKKDLYTVWQRLSELGLATPNIGLLTDLICCPGLDFCSLANAGSIGVSQDIFDLFEDLDYQHDIGELKIKMSGCMNGCGHHSVGHIGILGVDKHGEEWYQVTLGGSAENDATLGDRTGPSISRADIAGAVQKLIEVYLEQREHAEESFLAAYRRIGMAPFKQRLYGNAEHATEAESA
jgi:sulfite reductase (NADPH) hemoprotein beta-component